MIQSTNQSFTHTTSLSSKNLSDEQIALLKLLSFAENDLAANKTTSHTELLKEISGWAND